MNRPLSFFLCTVLALLCASEGYAQKFEGTITMEVTSIRLDKPMKVVTSIKGNQSMTEMFMTMGNLKMYMDEKTGKMTTVMESRKMGMEMNMKSPDVVNDQKDTTPPPVIEATGEKKVINGHSCQLYHVITHNNSQSNWWLTDEMPRSLLNSIRDIYHHSEAIIRSKNIGVGVAAMEKMFDKGLVPIQVEAFKDGKIESTMTFISYEQKHLDNKLFVISPEIKVQPMTGKM